MTIISLAGWKQSGKTRVAKLLVEEKGYLQAKFATPLKRIVERSTGLREGQIEDVKEQNIGKYISAERLAIEILVELGLTRWASVMRISEPSVARSNIPLIGITPSQMLMDLADVTEENTPKTYRKLLQTLGTDIMRNKWDEEFHLKMQKEWLEKNKGKDLVFDDVRFPNEIKLLESYGAKSYWLHRPALIPDDFHSSETSLGESDCGEVIISREGELLDKTIRNMF